MSTRYKEKLKKSLYLTVLLFAFVHIAILVVYSIVWAKIETINIFNILDLNYVLPGIGIGFVSQILSVLVILAVLGIFYFFF